MYRLNGNEKVSISNAMNEKTKEKRVMAGNWSVSVAQGDLSKRVIIREAVLLQSCQVLSDSSTSRTAARQASLSFTICWSFHKLMSTESVMSSDCLILCHSLVLRPSIFPSIRVLSNESALHIRWSKYWSFSFSPFNAYSELISFRNDWFDLSAVQGTLKSLF